jgi:hypothetical protein
MLLKVFHIYATVHIDSTILQTDGDIDANNSANIVEFVVWHIFHYVLSLSTGSTQSSSK